MEQLAKPKKGGLTHVEDAKRMVLGQHRPQRHQSTLLVDAVGSVLAADLSSPGDFPPFVQSNVDGYAFAYDDYDTRGALQLMGGTAAAGNGKRLVLEPGSAMRIFTGAPVPDRADTVIMQEDALVQDGLVRIGRDDIAKGANVRAIGSDVSTGQHVLSKGTVLSGPAIGLLASLGFAEIPVIARPRVAVIITGDELAVAGSPLRHGQVYESNGALLRATLRNLPVTLLDVAYVQDDELLITDALADALLLADVVLLTGGASVGDYDFVVRAATACGIRQRFHKVRQKPGKPLYYGKKGAIDVFGLPGNPASVLVCLHLYVIPALFAWAGYQDHPRPTKHQMTHAYRKPAGLAAVLKAHVDSQGVRLLEKQASYQLSAFAQANALAILPEEVEDVHAGDFVKVIDLI